jgi:hypothetical protein
MQEREKNFRFRAITSTSNTLLRDIQRLCVANGWVISSDSPQYRVSGIIDIQTGRRNLGDNPPFSSALKYYLPEDKDLIGK